MSLEDVRRRLVGRLEEGDRGDRGWFVITRVHVAVSWLKGIAEYLENRGGGGVIRLTRNDYRRLATIIETDSDDPGVQLRRHHLLVMDKPLQLLQRVDGRKWDQIVLTERGRDLAYTGDPASVLEQSLSAIQFAVEPWTPPARVEQYRDFDLQVYEVMKRVLRRCDGYIDRNEFDFFVSRIRRRREVRRAVAAIADYRVLAPEEQETLHTEIRDRDTGGQSVFELARCRVAHLLAVLSRHQHGARRDAAPVDGQLGRHACQACRGAGRTGRGRRTRAAT